MDNPDLGRAFANQLLDAFGSHIDREAPALVAVLEQAGRFCFPDQKVGEIVIDRRAILLAMLFVGTDQAYAPYASTASWFADWLKSRLPGRPVEPALARAALPPAEVLGLWREGYRTTLSHSVVGEIVAASQLAAATMGQPRAKLRHLFVAMLTDPKHIFEIEDLDWELRADDRRDLCDTLMRHIAADPEPNEKVEAWAPILERARLGLSSPSPNPPATPSPVPGRAPADFVSGFFADRTTDHDSDPLETEADVLAMARLICHEEADPPISIGVFGGWGSGKSTFMEALQWEVAHLANPDRKDAQPENGPRFVSPIVQIRFNAWQFADADLWASLTAEFFDQLRAGGFQGGGKRIHARLIQDVNEHVRGLSREAGVRRAAVDLAETRLRDAQIKHDDAVRRKNEEVGQALVSSLAEAYQRNKVELERYGLVDPASADSLDRFIALAREGRSQAGQLRHIGTILLAQWPLLLGLLLLAGVAAAAALAVAPDRPLTATIAAVLTAAAGLLPLARRGLDVIHAIVREVGPVADRIAQAEKQGLKQVLETEVALRSAAAESEALRAVADRADRALARYVDPSARANPPRVLRYLLEDDPDTKALEKEIGLIGRARRLFQALDEIVAANDASKERLRALRDPARPPLGEEERREAKALEQSIDGDIPDRIVLYIDDLDRCTHDQVYKVLQAVHLLLAFRLFVVVVAVDMAWVEAAVAASIEFAGEGSKDAKAKEKARRERAIEYLSKIFQLPFWLKPFAGADDRRYEKFVRSLTGTLADAPPPSPPPSRIPDRTPEDLPEAADDAPGGGPAEPVAASASTDDRKSAAGGGLGQGAADAVVRGLRTLQLTGDEEDFLASPAICALAASDPRGVKRLVNVYKIARARLSEMDEAMILGDDTRPPAYPFIALFAAVETGRSFATADALYDAVRYAAAQDATLESTDAGISAAIVATVNVRHGAAITGKEALVVAHVVRRYSFNRYH
ncbi:MAG: hypothetical protein JOZ90_01555 [Alphaproteobacteria bacterium]|nr:hypothetical protein [Alphaproteobacteria bacterium]MBV9370277.1 hypothetical protein [Alphaproteobacteria bacterium]MBV9899762.1 hypothetical protein [Alphaproteobacteria bacterium]